MSSSQVNFPQHHLQQQLKQQQQQQQQQFLQQLQQQKQQQQQQQQQQQAPSYLPLTLPNLQQVLSLTYKMIKSVPASESVLCYNNLISAASRPDETSLCQPGDFHNTSSTMISDS